MLKFENTYLNFGGTYLSGYKVPTYNVTLQQSEGGIIGATPLTGYRNTEVTLSNTPSQDYVFNGYEISGANLYDTNKFKFVDSDVTVKAKWSYDWPDPNPLNLPTNTMRVKCYPGTELSSRSNQYLVTKVGTEDECSIYDINTTANNWYMLNSEIVSSQAPSSSHWGVSDIIGVNNSAITSVNLMFARGWQGLYGMFTYTSSICYFDMSNVIDADFWFDANFNNSLSSLPVYNTSAVTSFDGAFRQTQLLRKQLITLDCRSCTSLNATFNNNYTWPPREGFPILRNTYNVAYWNSTFAGYQQYYGNKDSALVIPDYDFSNAINVYCTFAYNYYVSGGISSTYAKLSALGNQITAHSACFRNCGISSEQGRAELALIPSDWK